MQVSVNPPLEFPHSRILNSLWMGKFIHSQQTTLMEFTMNFNASGSQHSNLKDGGILRLREIGNLLSRSFLSLNEIG